MVSVTCSFDGGPGEPCTFPLEVGIDRFGTDNHTLVVTVVDVFGQTLELVFEFSLIEGKKLYMIMPSNKITLSLLFTNSSATNYRYIHPLNFQSSNIMSCYGVLQNLKESAEH